MQSAKDRKPGNRNGDQKFGKETFPRSARLLKPTDFKRVFKKSTASSDRYFKVLGSINDVGHSRLGMAVSRQVDKHAVGRNRIKRLIREHFRKTFRTAETYPNDGSKAGIDLVVLPRRSCATTCNSRLKASFAAHCLHLSRLIKRNGINADRPQQRPGPGRANQDAGTN